MACEENHIVVGSPEQETLPPSGYSREQLKRWIYRKLGAPIWNVELEPQHVLDCIQDALTQVSLWRPRTRFGALRMTTSKRRYLEGVDVGTLGIVDVHFVDNVPSPTEIFYGNLISPAPLIRTGLDEYDSFLRWRKTWQRVMSVLPDWLYDDYEKVLYIHNPIERFHAGVFSHDTYKDTPELPVWEATWVKDYALAGARYSYGDILNKFSGAIPGPIKDVQLDQGKRAEGEKQMTALMDFLKLSQRSAPITVD